MPIKRRGNRIDFTGSDASALARAILPSMRDKPTPAEEEVKPKPKKNGKDKRGGTVIPDEG